MLAFHRIATEFGVSSQCCVMENVGESSYWESSITIYRAMHLLDWNHACMQRGRQKKEEINGKREWEIKSHWYLNNNKIILDRARSIKPVVFCSNVLSSNKFNSLMKYALTAVSDIAQQEQVTIFAS